MNIRFGDIEFESSYLGPPMYPGVYMVVAIHPETKRQKILYIGSSSCIGKRVSNRKHPYYICYNRMPGHSIHVKYYCTIDYIKLEIDAIKFFRPVLNKKHK